jgi:hypothetical protein
MGRYLRAEGAGDDRPASIVKSVRGSHAAAEHRQPAPPTPKGRLGPPSRRRSPSEPSRSGRRSPQKSLRPHFQPVFRRRRPGLGKPRPPGSLGVAVCLAERRRGVMGSPFLGHHRQGIRFEIWGLWDRNVVGGGRRRWFLPAPFSHAVVGADKMGACWRAVASTGRCWRSAGR